MEMTARQRFSEDNGMLMATRMPVQVHLPTEISGLHPTIFLVRHAPLTLLQLMGLLVPVTVCVSTYEFFEVWPVIYRFFILLSVNGSWLMLISPVGYFLLQSQVTNKTICAVYSFCLCTAVVLALVCIAFTQAQVAAVDITAPEDSVVSGIRDYFDENGQVPTWIHELQVREQCCGFNGPEDWQKLIYPSDKPAIEDVPESCCITRVVGCNLVMHHFQNRSAMGKWIYVEGCRKAVERHLDDLLDLVAYGSAVLLMSSILLIAIFWCQLKDLLKTTVAENPCEVENLTASGIFLPTSENCSMAGESSQQIFLQPQSSYQFPLAANSDKNNANSLVKIRRTASTVSARSRTSSTKRSQLKETCSSPVTEEDLVGDRLNVRTIRTNSRLNSRSSSRRSVNKGSLIK